MSFIRNVNLWNDISIPYFRPPLKKQKPFDIRENILSNWVNKVSLCNTLVIVLILIGRDSFATSPSYGLQHLLF